MCLCLFKIVGTKKFLIKFKYLNTIASVSFIITNEISVELNKNRFFNYISALNNFQLGF